MAKQITQEQIDRIVERLIKRTDKANEIFLKNIGNKIDEINKLRPSEAYQLVQILKYGENYNEIIKKIDKYSIKNIQEIDKIFIEYAKKDQDFYKKFYQYRNIPIQDYSENIAIRTQTEALSNLTKTKLYAITRPNVLGYAVKDTEGNLITKGLREVYNDMLDNALMNIGQGKQTFDSALSDILKQVGLSGIKTINYESGRSVRLDSAIRMQLSDALALLHNENQKIYGKQFGADGYEISVHAYPAPDHEPVQGRQFRIEEYDKLDGGEDAKDIKGNTYCLDHNKDGGYRPISTLNCYHYIFPIIVGISTPEYSDEQLQQIIDENHEGFEYNGKHYTLYEGTQIQRSLEREVRKYKDVQILAKESNNLELISESQTKITEITRRHKELSKISGLQTKMGRMRVSGYRRTKVSRSE